MSNKVYVIGVGMTKFEKPGRRENWDYPDMARESGTKALEDAGIDYAAIEQGYVGYVYGESTSGQRALYELGLSGIPIVNVNNNCSTGSTALYLAAQAIRGGLADCTIALGFEKMKPGSLESTYDDRANPMDKHVMAMAEISEVLFPPAPWMFGAAGREHMQQYGSTAEHFAKIGYKNHKHSVNNPYAQFQESYTLEDILASRMIYDPLTKLQCSPTSDGSGAAILASEAFVDKHGLAGQAVEIVGQAMTTDFADSFDGTCKGLIGYHMNVQAAQRVYDQSGLGPADFQVIELHDCFSANELLLYEALGPVRRGRGGQADRQRRRHLWRALGGQPVRRPDLQGASAGRHRFGAVRRADLAAARQGRQAAGRQRDRRAAAQHRTRRRGRRHRVSAGRTLTTATTYEREQSWDTSKQAANCRPARKRCGGPSPTSPTGTSGSPCTRSGSRARPTP